jgi:hypothetical protein
VGGFKYEIDILESLAVTQFPRKLIAPTYLIFNNSVLGSNNKMSNNYSFNAILQPAVANTIQPLSANNLLSGQSGEISDIIGIIGHGGSAAISGNNVVWTGSSGYDYEIYFWDGSTTTQLTNYFTYDNNPQISGNNVVWYGYDGYDTDIYFWDGSTTTELTNNSK